MCVSGNDKSSSGKLPSKSRKGNFLKLKLQLGSVHTERVTFRLRLPVTRRRRRKVTRSIRYHTHFINVHSN